MEEYKETCGGSRKGEGSSVEGGRALVTILLSVNQLPTLINAYYVPYIGFTCLVTWSLTTTLYLHPSYRHGN